MITFAVMKYFWFILLIVLTGCEDNKKHVEIACIQLKDLKSQPVELSEFNVGKATVIYFISPDCPLCQGYSLTMRNISEQFANSEVLFIGVVSGKNYPDSAIDLYHIKYKIPFPVFVDEKKELTKKLGATVTPEVFLLDAHSNLIYQGKIDDWAVKTGVHKQVITEHYLVDALNALLNKEPVKIEKTDAVGCFIE